MEFYQKNKIIWNRLLLGICFTVGAYLFFNYVFGFIAPFFIGWVLSLLFNPLVSTLENKFNIKRAFGTLIAILLLILFFVVVVMGIWHKLYAEALLFYKNLPEYVELVEAAAVEIYSKLNNIMQSMPLQLQNIYTNFSEVSFPIVQGSGGISLGALKAIPNGFMVIIIALIASYFFTEDKAQIDALVSKHAPIFFGGGFVRAKQDLKLSVTGYFKTQLILMMYTFTICIVGLLVLNSPYSFLLSVIISIIDAIPFFGSGFILWPGALMFFVTGDKVMAIGYLAIYLCVNLMRQVMQPKILGAQIGLHPLLTLIAMYVGLKCLGLLGMILGPIVAVLLKAVLDAGEKERHMK